jgi:hypothetical protein
VIFAGIVLFFFGVVLGWIIESRPVCIVVPALGLLTTFVGALPVIPAIVAAAVTAWLLLMYVGIALSAYWSNRYSWSSDGDTAGVVFSVIMAPLYVVLGLIIFAGYVVWEKADEATK